ncbi:MAG TPA: glycosyltransferase family 4 protein [Terriglobia bacterium]
MLRIVHLDTGRDLRGGQWQLLLLARGLGKRGYEQRIVCPEGSALEVRARAEGFVVLSLRPCGLRKLSSMLALRREVRRDGFHVLHAHDGHGQTLSALASLGLSVRRVATRRVTFMPHGVGRSLGLHRLQYGSTCDAVVAVSRFIQDLLVRSGVAASKIEIIPDGIEIPAKLPDATLRARMRRQWGLDPEAFVIGHAGAFTHEKGQDTLLEAFLQAGGAVAGAQLLLAGEGPLRSAPKILGLLGQTRGCTRVLGWLEDLTPFFAALDLYVMPSRAEGLGSSVLLAMAHGLPVVASRVGGIPEVVEEARTGWLVPPASPSALAEALAAAASDRERLRRLGACARERAREFSDDTMVNRTEALYSRLTSARG